MHKPLNAPDEWFSRTALIPTNGTTKADMVKLNTPKEAKETEIRFVNVFVTAASPGVLATSMAPPLSCFHYMLGARAQGQDRTKPPSGRFPTLAHA